MYGEQENSYFVEFYIRESERDFKAGDIVALRNYSGKTNKYLAASFNSKMVNWVTPSNLIRIDQFLRIRGRLQFKSFVAVGFWQEWRYDRPYWINSYQTLDLSLTKPFRFESTGEAILFLKYRMKHINKRVFFSRWEI